MAASGNIKVVLEGRGPLTLRDNDYVTSGGEASIYRANATIVKLYADTKKMVRDGMADKIRLLAASFRHGGIVAPQGVVLDEHAKPVGFYMPFVEGEPMSRVFVTDFRTRTGFDDMAALILVDRMRNVVTAAHDGGAVMVDANELNWLVKFPDQRGPTPRVIDVDSWAIGHWPATVIMPSIRDWSAQTFDRSTDWFAWGIVSFQVFTGIHPYKGKIDGYRPGDLVQRMKDNASVFDKLARVPHAARDFSAIPDGLAEWYRATFQHGHRGAPPSPFDPRSPLSSTARTLRVATTSTGAVTFEKLFERVNDPVVRIWPCGAVRTASGALVDLSARAGRVNVSPATEVIRVGADLLIADPASAYWHFFSANAASVSLMPQAPYQRLMRAGDRLFALTGQELVELQLRVLGRPIITVARRWRVLPNATQLFDGVAVQDVLGAAFIMLPIGETGMVHFRVKELDGARIIAGQAYDRFAAFTVLNKDGTYGKVELTFDRQHQSYTVWTGGADGPEINMAMLSNGVVATIATDGELTIFVPANGKASKVADGAITTAMRLTAWGDKVVYLHDGAVWRLRVR